MPVVPLPERTLRPRTGGGLQAPDIGAGGRAIGQGMERLGGTLGQAAETEDQIDTIYATARAKQLDNEYQEFERDILFGDSGFYRNENDDAVNARPTTQTAISDKIGELLGRTKDQRERQILADVLERRRQSTFTGLDRYVQTEAKRFAITQANSRIENASENYSLYADTDPDKAAAERATVLSEVRQLVDLEGVNDPAIIAEREEAALSNMHSRVIAAQASGDPVKAAAYMEKWRHEIEPNDQLRLDSMMQPLLIDNDARQFAEQAEQFFSNPSVVTNAEGAAPGSPTTSGDLNAVWGNMIHTESGGRQTDGQNRTVTSPAGAIGIAQVMPETAREMAHELGIAFDETKYRRDARYNEMLGRAYFNKMLRTFNGDVAMAVAAYNAGPGDPTTGRKGVRGAIRAARAAGNANWRDYLPAETRGYLDSVLGPGGGGVAASPSTNPQIAAQQALTSQLEWAETQVREKLSGKPPRYIEQVVDQTKARIREHHAEQMQEIQTAQNAQWEQALETVFALGPRFMSITQVPGYQNLPVDRRLQLQSMTEANVAAAQSASNRTDDDYYTRLSDLYARNPEAFLQVSPAEARRKLDDSDYEQYVTWRREALKPEQNAAKRLTTAQITTIAASSLAAAGLSTTGQRGNNLRQTQAEIANFQRYMQRYADAFHTEHGRWPNEEEIRVKADKALMQMTWGSSGWFGGSTTGLAFQVPPEELDVRRGGTARIVVPEDIEARIRAQLPVGASDAEVRRIYAQGRGVHW